ncbi:hypothetical protein VZG28_05095 [Synechococcus elongatus IITB4]|uniref:hypothetical protein n=1 Tax=Synechococcus elongatus TaxID=32046 RepID=UPI0030D264FB
MYRFWGQPGTKEARERTADQTLGTSSARSINKDKVLVTLREYTGPADPNDPTQPSTFKVSMETLMTAQRLLLDTGNLNVFHQSIGSLTLLDDYRRWRDRVFTGELLKAEAAGKSSDRQGGYYYPGNKTRTVGGAPDISYAAGESAKFDVKTDLLEVVKALRKRNTPTFADGYYRCILDPTAMMQLRQDSDFREVARYPGMGQINPMQPFLAPNAQFYTGFGPAYGQAGFVAGQPVMPTGFLFEGVRWFESTNLPETSIPVTITSANITNTATPTALLMFFGPQSVGIGVGGNNAEILLNNNDDFSRFIIMIWRLWAGWEILQPDFVTIARTFVY